MFGSFLSEQVIVNSKYTANIFRNTSLYKNIIVIPIGINNRQTISNVEAIDSEYKYPDSNKLISLILIHLVININLQIFFER